MAARSNDKPGSWFEPESCVFCGSESLSPYLSGVRDHLGFVPGSWEFNRCRACGSVQLSKFPEPDTVAGLYPPVYSFRPDLEDRKGRRRFLASIEERVFYQLMHRREVELVKRVTGIDRGVLLDVGCGSGDRLKRFARAGFKVRGLEIQPELVDFIRDKLGFEADAGTLDTVIYDESSFDIVTIFYVIEHLLDVQSTLENIYRMLKPGGYVAAEVPLADSLQGSILRGRWSQYSEAPRHVCVPSREGIGLAMQRCGLADIEVLPAAVMKCASVFAFSAFPSASTTRAYEKGGTGLVNNLSRLTGGALTFLDMPAAAAENHLFRRPSLGLVFARKPGNQ